MGTVARFGFAISGQDRCVLSVAQNPKGELSLFLRANTSPFNPNPPAGQLSIEPPDRLWVREWRYSIHLSDESNNEINTIKMTKVLKDHSKTTVMFFTKAIKQDDTFCCIYARGISSSLGKSYDLKSDKAKYHRLGEISYLFLTPVLCVFVGNISRIFEHAQMFDTIFKQYFFDRFSLVLMWSYLSIAPHGFSAFVHNKPNMDDKQYSLSEEQCCLHFYSAREIVRHKYIDFVDSQGDPAYSSVARRMIFVKSDSYYSLEMAFWEKRLKYDGIIPFCVNK